MAANPVPVVGQNAQYIVPGQDPCAAVVVNVSRADEVSVAYWTNSGTPNKQQNVPFVLPGKTPPTQGGYVVPLPGGPTSTPAGVP